MWKYILLFTISNFFAVGFSVGQVIDVNLGTDKNEYLETEPIAILCEITNTSSNDIKFYFCDEKGRETGISSSMKVFINGHVLIDNPVPADGFYTLNYIPKKGQKIWHPVITNSLKAGNYNIKMHIHLKIKGEDKILKFGDAKDIEIKKFNEDDFKSFYKETLDNASKKVPVIEKLIPITKIDLVDNLIVLPLIRNHLHRIGYDTVAIHLLDKLKYLAEDRKNKQAAEILYEYINGDHEDNPRRLEVLTFCKKEDKMFIKKYGRYILPGPQK